jgi:hypothetical protein
VPLAGPAVHGDVLTVALPMLYGAVVLQVLNGTRAWAQLMAINATDPDGWAPGHTGSTGKRRTRQLPLKAPAWTQRLSEPLHTYST